MRNPNGYGSVVKLQGNRRKPYMVRKTKGFDHRSYPIYEVIGYTATREEGLALLAQYNQSPWDIATAKITLGQLHDLWLGKRSGKLGTASRQSLHAAWNYLAPLSAQPYAAIKAYQYQDVIDTCGKGSSVCSAIRNLVVHLDRFAVELDIPTKQYGQMLTVPPAPPTSRKPFTEDEVAALWQRYAQGDTNIGLPIILIYSGWRISELLTLRQADVDLDAMTMKGGIKTAAGKNRIVPIHPRILPLIQARMDGADTLVHTSTGTPYHRQGFHSRVWVPLNLGHTAHECRHTFETLLDNAGANRRCIDLMMGHASKDVGNKVYNHKTVQQLHDAIRLLP